MNSKQAEGFLHVAKTRNITKSAQALFLTAPTLSRHIAQMEEELGFPLFVRGANNLQLTPAGEIMYKTLTHLQKEFHQAVAHGKLANQANTERIAVGALHFFNTERYLQKYFEKYIEGNTAAEIALTGTKDPPSMRALLDDGTLDICFHTDQDNIKGDDYQNHMICPTYLYAIIGKAHPLIEQPHLTFADLDVEVRLETSSYLEPGMERLRKAISERYDMSTRQIIPAKSRVSQTTLIRLGQGYAIRNSAYTQRGDDDFMQIPIDVETRIYVMATWRKENHNPTLHRFISLLEQKEPSTPV